VKFIYSSEKTVYFKLHLTVNVICNYVYRMLLHLLHMTLILYFLKYLEFVNLDKILQQ